MKNFKRTFGILAIFTIIAVSTISCDYEEMILSKDNENTTRLIDPKKDCPPNDRNCNGIPDDQEE